MSESPVSSHSPASVDRERLVHVIEPVVRAHGAELVDVELKNEAGWVLRVYVEKLGASEAKMSTKEAAIDLELCSNISRDLSPALDVADPIPQRYNLEVGSPGVERPLKKAADFIRFEGEKAKLKLRNPVEGQKVLVGTLGPVTTVTATDSGMLAVTDGSKTWNVPLEDVVNAHLVFELTPAPKKGPHVRVGTQARGKKK